MNQEPQPDYSHRDEHRAGIPPGTPAWITRELIDLTIRVWQPYYQALLTAEDALAMIQSAGRLFQALPKTRGH